MKKLITLISLALLICSCHKNFEEVVPTAKLNSLKTITIRRDSIPDSACLKIQILKDSTMIDETAVAFFHLASFAYDNQLDSRYFPGLGIASLATLTSDGVPCASQCIPFEPADGVTLKVGSAESNSYILKLSYLHKFASNAHIWLKDKFLTDSADLRSENYAFSVNKADTSTFGSGRFKVVIR